jgi:hypothetical protein
MHMPSAKCAQGIYTTSKNMKSLGLLWEYKDPVAPNPSFMGDATKMTEDLNIVIDECNRTIYSEK